MYIALCFMEPVIPRHIRQCSQHPASGKKVRLNMDHPNLDWCNGLYGVV